VPEILRLMAVHAHPDDEVIPTGGTLRRYVDEGIETVLVTCTDGRHGFAPGFANPGEEGHVPEQVAATRLGELARATEMLGVTYAEQLGYGDSGMRGWATNADPASFCNADRDEATARLVALIERYRPQVLVTYDERDGSGHPDHVQAFEIALAAYRASGIASKFYLCVRSAALAARIEASRAAIGFEGARPSSGQPSRRRRSDDEITTRVATTGLGALKQAALACHASQLQDSHWLAHPAEAIEEIFSEETYIRLEGRTGAPLPETDLFAGLR
jgi:LmbE family N-acetylglucosaminyl deacetylase